jgi:hypothetical protein
MRSRGWMPAALRWSRAMTVHPISLCGFPSIPPPICVASRYTSAEREPCRRQPDLTVRESRWAILNFSGYDAASATPLLAEIVLRRQKFDRIVLATMSDHHQERIINLADGVDVVVLDGLTMPLELLWLIAERLSRLQQRA